MSASVDNLPQCKHFVTRKKRYCKMTVKYGEEYCGEHQKISNTTDLQEDSNRQIRIVCPLDRKHTCYAHNLKKHLKICNARESILEPYISKGVNSGIGNVDIDDTYKPLSVYSVQDIKNVISKVNKLYEYSVKGKITENFLTNKLVEEEMAKPEYGNKSKKHLKQASAILGLLNHYQLMKPKTCFIEFGAGRGQLSYWIAKSTELDSSAILLIERASPKHKRDNKLAKSTDHIHRIRADISDLVLDRVDTISKAENIVGVTKHLCGEATDLALRCLNNVDENKKKICGTVLTFCCHHRCRWIPYVGKEFFNEKELTKDDFNIMCGMASWATSGSGLSREVRNSRSDECEILKQNERDIEIGLSRQEKEEIGRKSKNILNWGRLVYLEKMGFKCVLHYYVDTNVSLENVCVVAYS